MCFWTKVKTQQQQNKPSNIKTLVPLKTLEVLETFYLGDSSVRRIEHLRLTSTPRT